jgi:hypothetical protein
VHREFGRRVEAAQALQSSVHGCCGGVPAATDVGGFSKYVILRNEDGPMQPTMWPEVRARVKKSIASMAWSEEEEG